MIASTVRTNGQHICVGTLSRRTRSMWVWLSVASGLPWRLKAVVASPQPILPHDSSHKSASVAATSLQFATKQTVANTMVASNVLNKSKWLWWSSSPRGPILSHESPYHVRDHHLRNFDVLNLALHESSTRSPNSPKSVTLLYWFRLSDQYHQFRPTHAVTQISILAVLNI